MLVIRGCQKKGSILVEALLSVVILSVSLTVIIQSMVSSLRSTKYASQYSLGLLLLENKMTELIREKGVELDFRDEQDFNKPYDRFKYKVDVDVAALNEDVLGALGDEKNLKDVNVDVSWGSAKRTNRVAVSTLFLGDADEGEDDKT